jgi:hypothetical protein
MPSIINKNGTGFIKLQEKLSRYPLEVRLAIYRGLLKAAKRKIEKARIEKTVNPKNDPDFECYFD